MPLPEKITYAYWLYDYAKAHFRFEASALSLLSVYEMRVKNTSSLCVLRWRVAINKADVRFCTK